MFSIPLVVQYSSSFDGGLFLCQHIQEVESTLSDFVRSASMLGGFKTTPAHNY